MRQNHRSTFTVMGIGGRGSCAIDHLSALGDPSFHLLYVNSDSRPLARSGPPAEQCILLGDGGEGGGGSPARGQALALAQADDIRAALSGTQRLLIVAGLGGGTGTGAAPLVASMARQMGVIVHALVTLPFSWEGIDRCEAAAMHLLREHAQSLTVMCNDELLALGDTVSQEAAFAHADAQVAMIAAQVAATGDQRLVAAPWPGRLPQGPGPQNFSAQASQNPGAS